MSTRRFHSRIRSTIRISCASMCQLVLRPLIQKDFNYKNQVEQLDKIQAKLKGRSTSLWSKNNDHSTADKYHSDAPELKQSDSGENTNEQAPSVGSTLEDTQ